mmetsp:Transcript_13778/g.17983  ORF Transcript_13778/g.17983 Transcript_13778/m.17983 type:complete len:81 (+) Transcript_13778:188-430(+)
MGGGGWYYVPKVWSPSGGWWNNPPQAKLHTGIALGAIGVLSVLIFNVSRKLERRPIPPVRPIPSQMWCKHAVEDDPRLAK